MCLVDCAKNMDLVQPATAALIAEAEISGRCQCVGQEITSNQRPLKLPLQLLNATRRESSSGATIKPDIMAIGTQWTRICFQQINQKWNKMQNSRFIR